MVLKVRVAQHLLTLLLDDRIRPLSPMTLVMLILSGMTARIVIQIHYRAACAPVPSLRHPLNGFKAMSYGSPARITGKIYLILCPLVTVQ